ncbi:MAG: hypothetical protein H5U00_03335 [Clostridia bacterium]|nr:hypothetical protein [Clostridia bacterium]
MAESLALKMNGQPLLLLATCSMGFLLGLFLDFYRFFARRARWRGHRLDLADFLLWVLFAVGMFALLFYLNGAEIHFYVFVGLALGLLTYYRWASRHVLLFLKKIFRGR